jgi:hypothetical protein
MIGWISKRSKLRLQTQSTSTTYLTEEVKMTAKRSLKITAMLALLVAVLLVADTGSAPVFAGGKEISVAPVYWTWDDGTPVGTAKLIRTPNGLSAELSTTGLPEGQAVTLWFMVFNNPDACGSETCVAPYDVGPHTEADFLHGGGHVVGGGTFSGHLQVGDTSGSGWTEIGLPEFVVGLKDPYEAQVVLALHSHGPKLEGTALKEQIGTYTGGCELPFLGDFAGFAQGPGDVPSAEGECSTIQVSTHD